MFKTIHIMYCHVLACQHLRYEKVKILRQELMVFPRKVVRDPDTEFEVKENKGRELGF